MAACWSCSSAAASSRIWLKKSSSASVNEVPKRSLMSSTSVESSTFSSADDGGADLGGSVEQAGLVGLQRDLPLADLLQAVVLQRDLVVEVVLRPAGPARQLGDQEAHEGVELLEV